MDGFSTALLWMVGFGGFIGLCFFMEWYTTKGAISRKVLEPLRLQDLQMLTPAASVDGALATLRGLPFLPRVKVGKDEYADRQLGTSHGWTTHGYTGPRAAELGYKLALGIRDGGLKFGLLARRPVQADAVTLDFIRERLADRCYGASVRLRQEGQVLAVEIRPLFIYGGPLKPDALARERDTTQGHASGCRVQSCRCSARGTRSRCRTDARRACIARPARHPTHPSGVRGRRRRPHPWAMQGRGCRSRWGIPRFANWTTRT